MSQVLTEYNDIFSRFYAAGLKPFKIFDIFVKTYTYYVMSHQEHYLMFYLSLNNLFNANMIIYDDPGSLSRNIFEINDAKQEAINTFEQLHFWLL